MPATEVSTRRYNLVLPEALYDELQNAAEQNHTSAVELVRRFIKLGLLALELQDKPDAGIYIREPGS
jgi:hypothetical protein